MIDRASESATMQIGVVIPTLNEQAAIAHTIRLVRRRGTAATIVVADCMSADRTTTIAAREGAVVVRDATLTSRAAAMNAGAKHALRVRPDLDALWFLHADSTPVRDWDQAIAEVLADSSAVGGAFDFQWDLRNVSVLNCAQLLALTAFNRARFRITKTFFGDQGIFVRADVFAAVGGIPPVALMEDVILCRRLKRLGRLGMARGRTVTSPRRFVRHGVLKQALIDAYLLTAERMGLEPSRLHAWYNREKV